MQHVDLERVLAFAKGLARKAGAEIEAASKKRWQTGQQSNVDGSKKNSVDLVTETDEAVEKMVKADIAGTFPSHKFVGEESFAAGATSEITAEPTWIVDPIDGTTNFVHGFPHCCISIGFAIDKKPTIGVIFNPFLDLLYEARAGHGAFCNGVRLPYSHPHPLPLSDLGSALIAVEWGSDRSKAVIDKKTTSFARLAADPKEFQKGAMCHSMRSIGSAALNYAYVASGQMDMYWEIGCYSWDVCAGIVVATEAGGRCYGRGGKLMDQQGKALMGRHFFVIRGLPDTPHESGQEAQDRLVEAFYDRVVEWEAN